MNARTSSIALSFFAVTALTAGACNKSSEPRKGEAAPAAKPVEAPAEAPAPKALPCDGPELAELVKQLDVADGFGVDHRDPKAQASLDAVIASIKGKRVAFANCIFKSQGNDEVSFAARADSDYKDQISCKMAGGEQGNKDFRTAAMAFDMARLKLDVVGTVGTYKDVNGFEHYTLTECKITPHE